MDKCPGHSLQKSNTIWDLQPFQKAHSATFGQKKISTDPQNASKQHTTLGIVVDAELIITAPALFRRPLPETTPSLFQNFQRTEMEEANWEDQNLEFWILITNGY